MEELAKAQFAAEMAEYGLTIEFITGGPIERTIRIEKSSFVIYSYSLPEFNIFLDGLRLSKIEKPKKKEEPLGQHGKLTGHLRFVNVEVEGVNRRILQQQHMRYEGGKPEDYYWEDVPSVE